MHRPSIHHAHRAKGLSLLCVYVPPAEDPFLLLKHFIPVTTHNPDCALIAELSFPFTTLRMNVPDDSDTEIDKVFDDRVRLRRRRALSNITNTPDGIKESKGKNVFAEALHNSMFVQPSNTNGDCESGNNVKLDVIDSPSKNEVSKLQRMSNTCPTDGSGSKHEESRRVKVMFRDIARVKPERHAIDMPKASVEMEKEPNGTIASKAMVGGGEARREEQNVLLRIQNELDELKEVHKRALKIKSKLIKVMEREVSELKKRIEAEKKEEIEDLRGRYEKALLEKRDRYRELCKQKIVEYKNALDEAYSKKATEYRDKCNEAVKRMRDMLRKSLRP